MDSDWGLSEVSLLKSWWICPKRSASSEGQGSSWPWLLTASSSWKEISYRDSGVLGKEDLDNLLKDEEGWGIWGPGVWWAVCSSSVRGCWVWPESWWPHSLSCDSLTYQVQFVMHYSFASQEYTTNTLFIGKHLLIIFACPIIPRASFEAKLAWTQLRGEKRRCYPVMIALNCALSGISWQKSLTPSQEETALTRCWLLTVQVVLPWSGQAMV